MSWDIVVFKLKREIVSVEEIDESVLIEHPVEVFKKALTVHFPNVKWDEKRAIVKGEGYEMECFLPNENSFSNTVFNLYGEPAVYAVINFCRKEGWQAFDTGLGEMLDLNHPENNGYLNFQAYLREVVSNGR